MSETKEPIDDRPEEPTEDQLEERNYQGNPLAQLQMSDSDVSAFMRPDMPVRAESRMAATVKEDETGILDAKNNSKALWVWGFLNKMGSLNKAWKTRIFLLKPDGNLSYYDGFEDKKVDVKALAVSQCLGQIPLMGCKVFDIDRNVHMRVKDSFCFGITPKGYDRTYVLEAATQKKRNLWIQVIGAMGGTVSQPVDLPRAQKGSQMEGYMEKMGEKEKATGWKVRYFILTSNSLSYYKSYQAAQRNSAAGTIKLSEKVQLNSDEDTILSRKYCFTLVSGNRRYIVSAADEIEKGLWMELLEGVCG
mmetsp:Transcript_43176/g.84633  ORF Transcript_43176/g.84633 Transcript_43176/m.84633 type:complete len:305 (-) Transcript_43176:294-1208(-)|eukprot:CAMPEP_0175146886 /NCGR_PEP_ID=MMETSP0087-20121206/15648_1 /TAXON_ID=136419 /ORGANISM="Unknown Unknown, Strain D1" /LENGTH=304 /DNA_ID=CAMNT_0016431939 /DNA_START=35 /DNA_END=949 /DNA_ORIENTATION=-